MVMEKRTVYLVDIENIPTRYSKQWRDWHVDLFSKNGFSVVNVGFPDEVVDIKSNEFMSFIPSNEYKARQTQILSDYMSKEQIKSDDIVYFLDAWHPGVVSLAQMKIFYKHNFKVYGFFHAGSYDEYDILGKYKDKFQNFERFLYDCLDKCFFATKFSKYLFLDVLNIDDASVNKCRVVGFLYKNTELHSTKKEKLIVFPHRIAPEKNPEYFDGLKSYFPDFHFIKTMEATAGDDDKKQSYHNILAKAKYSVSFAHQETFGISMVESLLSGCIPIVPNRLSYKEIYPQMYRYNSTYGDFYGVINHIKQMENYTFFDKARNYITLNSSICDMKKRLNGSNLVKEF